MKRALVLILVASVVLTQLVGCYSMVHTIGEGGGNERVHTSRQWFAVWGLVTIGGHDGGVFASRQGLTDYKIKTESSDRGFQQLAPGEPPDRALLAPVS